MDTALVCMSVFLGARGRGCLEGGISPVAWLPSVYHAVRLAVRVVQAGSSLIQCVRIA